MHHRDQVQVRRLYRGQTGDDDSKTGDNFLSANHVTRTMWREKAYSEFTAESLTGDYMTCDHVTRDSWFLVKRPCDRKQIIHSKLGISQGTSWLETAASQNTGDKSGDLVTGNSRLAVHWLIGYQVGNEPEHVSQGLTANAPHASKLNIWTRELETFDNWIRTFLTPSEFQWTGWSDRDDVDYSNWTIMLGKSWLSI